MPAIEIKDYANGSPVCVRLGSLSGVFKAQCEKDGITVSDQIRDTVARVLNTPDANIIKPTGPDDRIRVNLGHLKPEFIQWCKSRGLTTSAALRLLVGQSLERQILSRDQSALSESPQSGFRPDAGSNRANVVLGDQEQEQEPARIRLRLKPSEIQAITQMAEKRHVSTQRLAMQILRAFVLKAAAFSHQEIVDMGAVNLSLMRIGTNLNQIAKQLNAHAISQPRPGEKSCAEFEALNLEIRQCMAQLDDHVRASAHALSLSRERWRIELKD